MEWNTVSQWTKRTSSDQETEELNLVKQRLNTRPNTVLHSVKIDQTPLWWFIWLLLSISFVFRFSSNKELLTQSRLSTPTNKQPHIGVQNGTDTNQKPKRRICSLQCHLLINSICFFYHFTLAMMLHLTAIYTSNEHQFCISDIKQQRTLSQSRYKLSSPTNKQSCIGEQHGMDTSQKPRSKICSL